MTSLSRFWVGLLLLSSVPLRAGDWTPDPSLGNPAAHHHLYDIGRRYLDAGYDPAAKLIRRGTAHFVRESAYYAYGLLLTGDPADRARAADILPQVLAAQDTRADSPSRGAFLWKAEDRWEDLKNPDLNSAAFVGLALADVVALDRKRPALDPALRRRAEEACRLAVAAVMRRDVDPGYTNIALLSTALAAAGKTLFDLPGSGEFAAGKLDMVLGLAGDGVCYEYSSPTYTGVDFEGAYSARKFAFSPAFSAKADALIDHLWREVAASYHAPTFQLAGPFGRAYGDDILTYAAALKYYLYIALDGAYPMDDDVEHGWDQGGLVVVADLPVTARPEFKQPVPAWREFTARGPDDGRHPLRHLFQYREGDFILGTVAFQDEWKQKRNLVAYWRSDAPQPSGFRVGFCIDESNETLPDGMAYNLVHFHCQQVQGAALVAIATAKDLPGQGGLSLVFDAGAKAAAATTAGPLVVRDGSMTTYLYPVTPGAARFAWEPGDKTARATRPWTAADGIGSLHVLSYLAVFRPSGKAAPAVSGLFLGPGADGGQSVARATVDGAPLSVSFRD